ncbi:MAG: SDR family NAD(P)-dependent oxidoreductase, partial [Flavobacteriaceae bacterium]
QPLVLPLEQDENLEDTTALLEKLSPSFERYKKEYVNYYNSHKNEHSPAIRDASPVILLYPGVGLFSFAKNKQTARVASEFYINAINVMRGAEAISTYTALPRQEAFDIEYWLLEEAKLQRMPKEKTLSRKIAFVTGAAGGIGKAICDKLIEEGAHVVFADLSEERLQAMQDEYSSDLMTTVCCDVTKTDAIDKAYKSACLYFGGIDIVVHSAGLAISKTLEDHTLEDWDLLQNVLVKAQFELAQKAAELMKIQGLGGDIISIASKNGVVSGPNNIGYGTAKAAQQHMTRLLAAELGKAQIRVNVVNPDGVIIGSKIWEGEWAEGRAKAYGVAVEDLPAHYAKRNLMSQIIYPSDIADGVFALVGVLKKSTGNMINVDGGMPQAFVR